MHLESNEKKQTNKKIDTTIDAPGTPILSCCRCVISTGRRNAVTTTSSFDASGTALQRHRVAQRSEKMKFRPRKIENVTARTDSTQEGNFLCPLAVVILPADVINLIQNVSANSSSEQNRRIK